MAMDGLLVFTCALLVSAPPDASPAPSPERGQADFNTALAVQNAMRMAGEHLQRGDAKAAVLVLEGELARINGSRKYLELLATAYRKYIKDLSLAERPAEARKYLERLAILEPEAAKDRTLVSGPAPLPGNIGQRKQTEPAAVKGLTARAKSEDPKTPADPFDKAHESKQSSKGRGEGSLAAAPETRRPFVEPAVGKQAAARNLVERASAEFKKERYAEAHALFEEAARADEQIAESSRGQWAYCKLHGVVDKLNARGAGKLDLVDLTKEVQLALHMAPRLEKTGKWLLHEIDDRRNGAGRTTEKAPELDIRVQHQDERNAQGWRVAETASFRIFHNQPREVVEQAARVVEQTRVTMQKKWFGQVEPEWSPKCNLYLHADGKEYQHFTGVPATSPGHSRMETDGERVISRRVDVRCDNPNMLTAVLPHEATHVVLAGQFGKHQVPRWVDEGIAVLTEPSAKVELHRKNLARCRDHEELFAVRDLMNLDDYPQPRRIGAFYAQSVSLVDFLSKEGGPVTFSRFVRDALQDGYEAALRKHYKYHSFEELQESWNRHAFGGAVTASKSGRD